MIKATRLFQVCVRALVLLSFSCSNAQTNTDYTFKKGSYDGIGKWYMGREIAHVMGHQGIGWLERANREEEEGVSLLLANMANKPGEIIADIGAGSGYHAKKMAAQVGATGKVYAVDIQPEMLNYIEKTAKKAGLQNIELVLGTVSGTNLPAQSVDKILLVDVYHEFDFPKEMASSMLNALKPGGKLYLIEYRAEDPDVPIKPLHKMTEKQAVMELAAAGFKFVENMPNLPWQHCMVFTR